MFIVTGVRFAQLAILARVLDPVDFGLMAIMMVVIGFSQAFQDMGISNAIIQRQNISHTQLSSLYWLNIFSGVLVGIIIAAIAPFIAEFYNDIRITNLLIILSTSFALAAIGNQYRVLCQKNLDFRTFETINIIGAVAGLIISVCLAFKGFGVLSLVLGMIVQVGLSSLLFLWVGLNHYHRPSLVYRHSELRGIYEFGLYQMGERAINYISANADKILIGKFAGLNATGIYNLGWSLVIFPLSSLNPIVNKVSFPIYSNIQEDLGALNRYYCLSIRALSVATMPILVFLLFFSQEVVQVMFGNRWLGVAELLPALALVGIIKALGNPGGAITLALGRADVGFWWNLIWAIFVISGLSIGLSIVPSAQIAADILVGLSLTVGLFWHYLIARISKVDYRPIVKHLLQLFLVVFGIVSLSLYITGLTSIDQPFIRILIAGIFCILFYTPYLFLFEKQLLQMIKEKS
jgi:O-antigen/teichoic acid export membrane protein